LERQSLAFDQWAQEIGSGTSKHPEIKGLKKTTNHHNEATLKKNAASFIVFLFDLEPLSTDFTDFQNSSVS